MKSRNLKRDAIKNYFPLPNEIFSFGLKPGEIVIYAYLIYRENRKTFQCYPSYKTIGHAVGMSQNTVRKYVRGLEDKGLILTEPTVIHTKNGKTFNGNLLYTVVPIKVVIDNYNEKQLNAVGMASAFGKGKRIGAREPP